MTRYILIFWILLIAPNCSTAQSFSIDSSTLKASNDYLIKGLKARELVQIYKKQRVADSIHIDRLNLAYNVVINNNAKLCDENSRLGKQNKTLWAISLSSIALSVLLILFN